MTTDDLDHLAHLAEIAGTAMPSSATSSGALFLLRVYDAADGAVDTCEAPFYTDEAWDLFMHETSWLNEATGDFRDLRDEAAFAAYVDLELFRGPIADEAAECGFPDDTGFCLARAAYNLAARVTNGWWRDAEDAQVESIIGTSLADLA